MLHPSYSELIDILNSETDTDNQITSRYTIVIAAAKRARQLVNGSPTATGIVYNDKAVSTAVNELENGKIKIILSAQAQQENREFDLGTENTALRREEKLVSHHILVDDEDDIDEIDEFEDFEDEEADLQADSELLKSILGADDELDDEGIEKISLEEAFEDEMFADELEDDLYDDDDSYGD